MMISRMAVANTVPGGSTANAINIDADADADADTDADTCNNHNQDNNQGNIHDSNCENDSNINTTNSNSNGNINSISVDIKSYMTGINMNTIPFPFRLHDMLDESEKRGHSGVVSWCREGESFRIKDPSRMVGIIKKYFRQTKYKSFLRQLQGYGFARITRGADRGICSHPNFVRGKRSMCATMRRRTTTAVEENVKATTKSTNSTNTIKAASTKKTEVTVTDSTNSSSPSCSSVQIQKINTNTNRYMNTSSNRFSLKEALLSSSSSSKNELRKQFMNEQGGYTDAFNIINSTNNVSGINVNNFLLNHHFLSPRSASFHGVVYPNDARNGLRSSTTPNNNNNHRSCFDGTRSVSGVATMAPIPAAESPLYSASSSVASLKRQADTAYGYVIGQRRQQQQTFGDRDQTRSSVPLLVATAQQQQQQQQQREQPFQPAKRRKSLDGSSCSSLSLSLDGGPSKPKPFPTRQQQPQPWRNAPRRLSTGSSLGSFTTSSSSLSSAPLSTVRLQPNRLNRQQQRQQESLRHSSSEELQSSQSAAQMKMYKKFLEDNADNDRTYLEKKLVTEKELLQQKLTRLKQERKRMAMVAARANHRQAGSNNNNNNSMRMLMSPVIGSPINPVDLTSDGNNAKKKNKKNHLIPENVLDEIPSGPKLETTTTTTYATTNATTTPVANPKQKTTMTIKYENENDPPPLSPFLLSPGDMEEDPNNETDSILSEILNKIPGGPGLYSCDDDDNDPMGGFHDSTLSELSDDIDEAIANNFQWTGGDSLEDFESDCEDDDGDDTIVVEKLKDDGERNINNLKDNRFDNDLDDDWTNGIGSDTDGNEDKNEDEGGDAMLIENAAKIFAYVGEGGCGTESTPREEGAEKKTFAVPRRHHSACGVLPRILASMSDMGIAQRRPVRRRKKGQQRQQQRQRQQRRVSAPPGSLIPIGVDNDGNNHPETQGMSLSDNKEFKLKIEQEPELELNLELEIESDLESESSDFDKEEAEEVLQRQRVRRRDSAPPSTTMRATASMVMSAGQAAATY